MHADLVGSSCLRRGFDQREWVICSPETLEDTKAGVGRRAVGMDSLFQPDPGCADSSLSQQRLVNVEGFFTRPTEHDRIIDFLDPVTRHHQAQFSSGLARFRDKSQTARFAIEPVYKRYLSAIDDLIRQKSLQFIPERFRSSGAGWVHEKICRFVNHEKPVIFINDA